MLYRPLPSAILEDRELELTEARWVANHVDPYGSLRPGELRPFRDTPEGRAAGRPMSCNADQLVERGA